MEVKAERLMFGSAVVPALLIASVNAYNLWNEHWNHWAHMPPLEERTEYPYQNIRTKNFCWGDGDKVSSTGPIRNFGFEFVLIYVRRLFCKLPRQRYGPGVRKIKSWQY